MEEYHCLDLQFKDSSISKLQHHAHLYVENDKIFIRIFLNKNIYTLNNFKILVKIYLTL